MHGLLRRAGGDYSDKKLGAGVRPASQNTYPVYDKICDFKYPIYVLTLNQDPVSDLPYN